MFHDFDWQCIRETIGVLLINIVSEHEYVDKPTLCLKNFFYPHVDKKHTSNQIVRLDCFLSITTSDNIFYYYLFIIDAN